jgi:hypothetical protein
MKVEDVKKITRLINPTRIEKFPRRRIIDPSRGIEGLYAGHST